MSATDNLGPHLLGRLPSPPDARDYRLEDYLAAADPVAQAVAELKQTTVGYVNSHWKTPPAGTHWANALALLQAPAPPPANSDVTWDDPEPVLDQGQYGTCVGNGCAQWGNTLPVGDKFTETDARAIYREATVLDGADDPTYQTGASVRSGVKALKNRGRLSVYASTSSVETMKTWLAGKGSIIVGTDWLDTMFQPDSNGYVKPVGNIAGGHCYLARGVLYTEQAFLFRNSWGANWGLAGDFKMKWADFATLLAQNGEAWTAVELP